MCELGSVAVPNPVSIPKVHENFAENGKTSNSHIIDNVEKYIQKLEWYAEALKEQKKKAGTLWTILIIELFKFLWNIPLNQIWVFSQLLTLSQEILD